VEGEDHLAADLVLVVPEAGVDRVEWAKQLVGNAMRSPHSRQAYEYALEQFFVWAAGRAISRDDCHGRRGEPKGQTAGPVACSTASSARSRITFGAS
jgi:hypothetical protein